MKPKKQKPITISAGPCCRCDTKKIKLLYEELPPNIQEVFKMNPPKEVGYYLHCPKCLNYTAMPKKGGFWF